MNPKQFLFNAILLLMSVGQTLMAQTFRTAVSGNWTSLGTWQQNFGSWVAATSFPGQTSTDAIVTIQASHQVYINSGANIHIQDLIVETGGNITVRVGGRIIINDELTMNKHTGAAIIVNSEQAGGTITAMDCEGATLSGSLVESAAAVDISLNVDYTGGNGTDHFGQTLSSTGVTGLTAVLESSTFAIGNGTLTYIITGTPGSSGTANFALNIGGQTCTASFAVDPLEVSGNFTDSRDNQVYKWVRIGNQVWMAENLNYVSAHSWSGCYNNSSANCDHYGRLYSWMAAMNGASSSSANPSGVQGVCPAGWHVPSDAEWTQLVNYVVSQGYPNSNVINGAANALKSCRQKGSPLGGACNTSSHPRWDSHITHYGFDAFDFSVLPGGWRHNTDIFNDLGYYGYWWSATQNSTTYAWLRGMRNDNGNVDRTIFYMGYGASLRCVLD